MECLKPLQESGSLWSRYKAEMHGLTVIEQSYGFCAFTEAQDSIFIDEFYVVPEHRQTGFGKTLLNQVKTAARIAGKRHITSTVSLGSKTASLSLLAQLHVGFQVVRAENNSLLLKLYVGDANG